MTRPFAVRLGVIGALVAVLLLPGCGRKGPLDPPPTSMLQPGAPGPGPGPSSGSVAPPARGFDEEGKPVAPPGKKAHQFLDWLLD